MLIREIMVAGDSVRRVNVGQPISEAAALMRQHKVSALPVVDAEGVVVGIVSQRNVEEKCRNECRLTASGNTFDVYDWLSVGVSGTDPQALGSLIQAFGTVARTTVDEIMTSAVITARPEETATAAVRRMATNQINHLPVVGDDGRLIGIVARGDIIKALGNQPE